MKKIVLLALAALCCLCLTTAGLAAEKGSLWDGNQWVNLPYDAKVGYIKGVGNLADYEVASAKGGFSGIAPAFEQGLRGQTVDQIVKSVDKFYADNPGKLNSLVLEVILRTCSTACPPEMKK
jgi:hypothetical protein